MTPTVIHRYSIPALEAVRALFDVGDCQEIQVAMVGSNLVVDVIEPAGRQAIAEPPSIEMPAEEAETPPAAPERKGGELARKAGILCSEKGFRTFLALKYDADAETAGEAADWVRQHCDVRSRADLDYEQDAAAKFAEVARLYGLWLDGYDV